MRLGAWIGASSWAFLVVAACSTKAPDSPPSAPVRIGALLAVTGDLAGQGKDFTEAEGLAIAEINAAGGVLGRPASLVIQDDGTTPEGATSGYRKLLDANVPVIVGPSTSAQALAIKSAGLFDQGQRLTLAATPTSPELTGLSPFFARLSPPDTVQAVILAKLIDERPEVTNLCVIHRADTYGTNLARELGKRLQARADLHVTDVPFDPAATDLSGAAQPCIAVRCPAGADGGACDGAPSDASIGVVLITFVSDGAVIVNELVANGFSASKNAFFFTDGARDPGLLTLVTDQQALEGAHGTAPGGPDVATPAGDVFRAFQQRYAARYGRPPNLFAELAYDTVYLAALSVELAGTDADPRKIVDAFPRTQQGAQTRTGDWKALADIAHRDGRVDYVGASGDCNFDPNGDPVPPYYFSIWTISNDAISTTRTETCADPTTPDRCPLP